MYKVYTRKGSTNDNFTLAAENNTQAKRETTLLLKELGYIPYDNWHNIKDVGYRRYFVSDNGKPYHQRALISTMIKKEQTDNSRV